MGCFAATPRLSTAYKHGLRVSGVQGKNDSKPPPPWMPRSSCSHCFLAAMTVSFLPSHRNTTLSGCGTVIGLETHHRDNIVACSCAVRCPGSIGITNIVPAPLSRPETILNDFDGGLLVGRLVWGCRHRTDTVDTLDTVPLTAPSAKPRPISGNGKANPRLNQGAIRSYSRPSELQPAQLWPCVTMPHHRVVRRDFGTMFNINSFMSQPIRSRRMGSKTRARTP